MYSDCSISQVWSFLIFYFLSFHSYPRTESTAYPSSLDVRAILSSQQNHPLWGDYAHSLLTTGAHAPKGGVDVGDHPPITPMRSATEMELAGGDAWRLYQYVTQHFLGSVSPDCRYVKYAAYI